MKSQLPFNAGCLEFTYDKLNRQRKISHPSYNQEIPENGFDKAGNLLCYTQNDEAFEFTYDDLYQLNAEKGHQYSYDSLHNRIQKNQHNCQISTLNQVLEEDNCKYKYDANGNLIEKTEAGKVTTYSYDAWNRLTVSTTNNQTSHYIYDAFHRRLSKNKEKYLYYEQDEIGAVVDGKIHNLRILGLSKEAEISGAVACELQDEIFLPLHDHNGNVTTLLSPKGTAEKTYRYSAFGIEYNPDRSDSNPWRFSSKRYDSETDFIYFGRRYYDPLIGRWITSDPIEYADGPNLYAYVHNKPLTHFDPYGLFGFTSAELPSFSYSMDVHQHINDFGSDLSFRDIYQPVSSFVNSNIFQGSMRALGGLSEAGIGGAFALSSIGTGVGPLAGFALMAHGFDNFQSGMNQCFRNAPCDPLTVQGLQKAGLSHNNAHLINNGISLFGSLGVGVYTSIGNQYSLINPSVKLPSYFYKDKSYDIAKQGGKHCGFFKNNVSKPISELEKGIIKFEKQIELHRDKINDPSRFIENWFSLDVRQQKALINKKWPSDIQRLSEQKKILKGIINER